MQNSNRVMILAALVLLALTAVPASAESSGAATTEKDLVEHGRYLVQNVSMCGFCHTPRDSKGRVIQYKAFHGAVIPISPPEGEDWALVAPSNLGFVGYSDEQAILLLTKGIQNDGTKTKPPMPPYRFTEDDAKAVVAFLRSLR